LYAVSLRPETWSATSFAEATVANGFESFPSDLFGFSPAGSESPIAWSSWKVVRRVRKETTTYHTAMLGTHLSDRSLWQLDGKVADVLALISEVASLASCQRQLMHY